MKVLVKRDSATSTPVDVGEGDAADAAVAKLVLEHGPQNVTNEDGSPIEVKPAAKPQKKPKGKASKSKKRR